MPLFSKVGYLITRCFLLKNGFPDRPRWAGGSKSLHEDKAEEAHEASDLFVEDLGMAALCKKTSGEQRFLMFNSELCFAFGVWCLGFFCGVVQWLNYVSDVCFNWWIWFRIFLVLPWMVQGFRRPEGVFFEPKQNPWRLHLIWCFGRHDFEKVQIKKGRSFLKAVAKCLWIDSSGPPRSTP